MKKLKNWLILPLLIMLVVPMLILTACGDDKGGGGDKFYGVTMSGQMPAGVSEISLLDGHEVKEGENVDFTIRLQRHYEIGDLKVFANDVELVSFESQDTANGIVYYYRITNIRADVTITFTGATTTASYDIKGYWVNYPNTTPKSDDKKLEDFLVDITIQSVNGNSTAKTEYSFGSVTEFKDYLESDVFYSSGYLGDILSFTIYSKDNCESYVDDWIICNDETIVPETKYVTEEIGDKEVSYLQAKYNVYISNNTTIYFYEKEIVRSAEIKTPACVVSGIDEKDVNLPKIVLKDGDGVVIDRYAKLKTAGTINAYIENINDVWRPLFNNKNLEYSLTFFDDRYVFEEGEYVSDKGSFVFKNVGIPYMRCTYAYYTLYIDNAKELIMSESNYKKMSVTKTNIKKHSFFEQDYIYVEGEGEYCYVQCQNRMYIEAYDKYTKIKIELSNDAGATETIVMPLPSNSKSQVVTGGYTISRRAIENGYKRYLISYDGTGVFYNNIKLTALEG